MAVGTGGKVRARTSARLIGVVTGTVLLAVFLTVGAGTAGAASQPGPALASIAPLGFGDAFANPTALASNAPMVGMASTPDGKGYWEAAADGGLFAFGNATFYGSMGGHPLNQPIVGMASTPDGKGYWLVASDGGIFAFGDAAYFGSTGGHPLNQPIVGMVATPSGHGYWLVASDGGIFAFGDAVFGGSMGGHPLNQPIVGMASNPEGNGYWLVAADGGIFSFGGAPFEGSLGSDHLAQPIVGMAASPGSVGYWLVGTDGGVFAFGGAHFDGSFGGEQLGYPFVAITPVPHGTGYWLLPTTAVTKALGAMTLSPAPSVSTVSICAQTLYLYEDATFAPLTCGGGAEVNVVAWSRSAGISPVMLSLGPDATPGAVLGAFCADVQRDSTNPLELEAYSLASLYYRWPFTIAGSTFLDQDC
jgi:hypothetical protein